MHAALLLLALWQFQRAEWLSPAEAIRFFRPARVVTLGQLARWCNPRGLLCMREGGRLWIRKASATEFRWRELGYSRWDR